MTGQLFPRPPRRLKQPTKDVLRQHLASITEENIRRRGRAAALGLVAAPHQPLAHRAEGHRMSKYTELDAAIVHAIENHASQCAGIVERVRADALAAAATGPKTKPLSRYVDARLQSLRKAGRIKFANGHWSIA